MEIWREKKERFESRRCALQGELRRLHSTAISNLRLLSRSSLPAVTTSCQMCFTASMTCVHLPSSPGKNRMLGRTSKQQASPGCPSAVLMHRLLPSILCTSASQSAQACAEKRAAPPICPRCHCTRPRFARDSLILPLPSATWPLFLPSSSRRQSFRKKYELPSAWAGKVMADCSPARARYRSPCRGVRCRRKTCAEEAGSSWRRRGAWQRGRRANPRGAAGTRCASRRLSARLAHSRREKRLTPKR